MEVDVDLIQGAVQVGHVVVVQVVQSLAVFTLAPLQRHRWSYGQTEQPLHPLVNTISFRISDWLRNSLYRRTSCIIPWNILEPNVSLPMRIDPPVTEKVPATVVSCSTVSVKILMTVLEPLVLKDTPTKIQMSA